MRGQKKRRYNKRKKELKKKKLNEKDNQDADGPFYQMLENPFESLTDEERRKAFDEIGENSEKSFNVALLKIQTLLKSGNILNILSTLSNYGLSAHITNQGIEDKEREERLEQSHVELCQALALQVKQEDLKTNPINPDIIQDIWSALYELQHASFFKGMSSQQLDLSDDEKAVVHLQKWIRGNTQMVRNWGFYSQVKTISQELYSYFDELLLKNVGFTATNAIVIFDYMISSVEAAMNNRMQILSELAQIKDNREMMYKYHEILNLDHDKADTYIERLNVDSLTNQQIFFMLLSHYDLFLIDNYTFEPNKISTELEIEEKIVIDCLDSFSYKLGGLEDYETEYLFLSNPIWTKPIIKFRDNNYFCPIPQLFFSFILLSLDEIVEKLDKKQLHERRAKYLEDKVDEIVRRRFPEANTVTGVEWEYEEKGYETDLITVIDSCLIIVEAKSGKITEPALRGAPDRIKKHIKDILLSPNEQSSRLKLKLTELIDNPDLEDALREKLPVDLNQIHKIIRISVSLEYFAAIQANVSYFKDTGWLPEDFVPCPTMNIADFETLFDYLEHPVQIIHYLERRQEIEASIKYLGDELDLMGWYYSTLFNFGDIDKNAEWNITGMSKPLDNYYQSKDQGILLDKPNPKMSDLFLKILTQLEQRKTHRWTEIGAILHRFPPKDQEKLTKLLGKLEKNVRRKWKDEGHENILLFVPPQASIYAMSYVLYLNDNSERRNEFINAAARMGLDQEHVKYCLVIAKNIDRNELAYHFIGLFE